MESWNACWALLEAKGISTGGIGKSLRVIQTLHDRNEYLPPEGWTLFSEDELSGFVSEELATSALPHPAAEIAAALKMGQRVYDLPSIATDFFAVLAPAVDPENESDYLAAGRQALAADELRLWWYFYAESQRPPGNDFLENFKAYRAFFDSRGVGAVDSL